MNISCVNLFLEHCANKEDFKLGITAYQYAMSNNLKPNEITFGIMIKIYGIGRQLETAFELLDLM